MEFFEALPNLLDGDVYSDQTILAYRHIGMPKYNHYPIFRRIMFSSSHHIRNPFVWNEKSISLNQEMSVSSLNDGQNMLDGRRAGEPQPLLRSPG